MTPEQSVLLGRVLSGVAHDLNNALTGGLGYLHFSAVELSPGPVLDDLKKAEGELLRMKTLLETLLLFTKGSSAAASPREVIDGVLSLCQYEANRAKIAVERNYAEPLPALQERLQPLRWLLLAVFLALMESLKNQSSPRIRIDVGPERDGERIRIAIHPSAPAAAALSGADIQELAKAASVVMRQESDPQAGIVELLLIGGS